MNDSAKLTSQAGAPVIVESSAALPLVSITVALRSGALEDPPHKEGLSRLTTRLMRRTGGGMSARELDQRIDSLGGSLGVDVSHSILSLSGTVIRRNLGPFLDLVRRIAAQPSFEPEELDRLKRETAAELVESRDNDRTLARRWFRRKLFDGHPYTRPVSGTIHSVEMLTQADVVQYHRQAFVRGNLVFGFSGAIDEAEALDAAREIEAALPDGTGPADSAGDPAVPAGRRLLFIDKPERTQTQILIGGLGTHPRDPDHTALVLANTIFGGTFTARMTREIRSKRGWSYGAYSSLHYDRHRQSFSMWTFPKATDAAACVKLQLEMLHSWWQHGVTSAETAWAKRYMTRSHAFAIDTAGKRAAQALETELYALPPNYHAGYLDRVRGVTVEAANAAIQTRIRPANLLIAVVGTHADVGGQIEDAIEGLAATEVVAFDTDA